MRRAAPCGAILLGGSNRLEEMNVPNNRLDFPDGSVLTVLESAAEQNRDPSSWSLWFRTAACPRPLTCIRGRSRHTRSKSAP